MYKGKKIAVIIPARGGSKGIPRKNVRFLGSKPLIYYAIRAAKKAKYIDGVFVSSEDDFILNISKMFEAEVIKRPHSLSRDEVTLDPVIHHAVLSLENMGKKFDIIITLQPTVPLITPEDLDKAIEYFVERNLDTLVFGVDATHIYWYCKNSECKLLFEKRQNRQYMPKIIRELGILITKREHVTPQSRFGKKVEVFTISEEKGVDIDSHIDMLIANVLIQRKKIAFIVDGRRETGLGHIYRCLTLAEKLIGHSMFFFTNGSLGKKLIEENGYKPILFRSTKKLLKELEELNPDIIINDILDTDKDYILSQKQLTKALIVNFEDLGTGSYHADLVFNALYEFSEPPKNHYYGYKYFILRDEFKLFPIKDYSKITPSNTITVIYGGVDPNNLTLKTIQALQKAGIRNYKINVIVGPGYKRVKELKKEINKLKEKVHVKLHRKPGLISKIIYESDFALTSNGRTLYEIVSLGVPVISIAQNERELLHLFARLNKGIIFLGLASNVSENDIISAVKELTDEREKLIELNKRLIPYAKDIRKGTRRVIKIILEEAEEHGEANDW